MMSGPLPWSLVPIQEAGTECRLLMSTFLARRRLLQLLSGVLTFAAGALSPAIGHAVQDGFVISKIFLEEPPPEGFEDKVWLPQDRPIFIAKIRILEQIERDLNRRRAVFRVRVLEVLRGTITAGQEYILNASSPGIADYPDLSKKGQQEWYIVGFFRHNGQIGYIGFKYRAG